MLSTPTTSVGGPRVRFVAEGIPQPQGSKGCTCRNGRGQLFDTNAAPLRRWRKAVTDAAVIGFDGVEAMAVGAIWITAEFRFPMPGSRPLWMREAGRVWKVTPPDTDKLQRAVGDALTDAGVISDDAQLMWRAFKTEVCGLWIGADITMEQVWSV